MKLPRNFYKPLAIGAPAPPRELPVLRLIPRQIPSLNRIRQCHRLPKSQRQSFPRNRVHAA